MDLPLAAPRLRLLPVATLFLAGALFGTLTDQIFLLGGVTAYPAGGLFGQPAWVPLLYACAAPALALPARWLLREPPGSARDLLVPSCWFLAAYFAGPIFQQWPAALTAGLVAAFAARTREPRVIAYAVGCALGGVAWEIALSSRGYFLYLAPHAAFGVPWWLFGLYLHAALLMRQVARLL